MLPEFSPRFHQMSLSFTKFRDIGVKLSNVTDMVGVFRKFCQRLLACKTKHMLHTYTYTYPQQLKSRSQQLLYFASVGLLLAGGGLTLQ